REWLTVELREDWTTDGRTYPGGALLAIGFEAFLAGGRDFLEVYTPTAGTSLAGYTWTARHLVLNILDDVKSRLEILTPADGEFSRCAFTGAPAVGTVAVAPVDPRTADDVWLYATDFLSPTTL